MKVLYRQTASDDIVRQFRYYLLTAEAPEIALRFREAVKLTIQSLSQNPYVGPRFSSGNPRLQNLRSVRIQIPVNFIRNAGVQKSTHSFPHPRIEDREMAYAKEM